MGFVHFIQFLSMAFLNDKIRSLISWYSGLNIYYKLFPFLLLYLIRIALFHRGVLVGDEGRYLTFAKNLLNGFYSPQYPYFDLWNGPGYPILISPFVLLKLPLVTIRLLNGILLYFSLILNYKTFNIYSSKGISLLFTILLAFYFPILRMLTFILTEVFAWFLVSLICYLFVKCFKQSTVSWKLMLLVSFSIACLAMTKVIFGHVIMIMLFISSTLCFFRAFHSSAKKAALIFLASFIFCLPWLVYTHSVTGKIFYWTNSGGMSLYTMSTPFPDEFGDWVSLEKLSLNPNHKVFIDSISKLNPLERDIAFKSKAIENIKNHPKKFLLNVVDNVGRMLFYYPFSHTQQTLDTYFIIIPNIFVAVFIILSLMVSAFNSSKIPPGLFFILLFFLVYLAGSSLLSAYARMFYITIPFWYFYILYVFSDIVSIKIREDHGVVRR